MNSRCILALLLSITCMLQSVLAADIINVSTRGLVGIGEEEIKAGFIVSGSGTKKVLVTGQGSTLSIPGAISDPVVVLTELFSGTVIDSNDNWQNHPTAAEVEVLRSSGIVILNPFDSAFIVTLPEGQYIASLSSASGQLGIGIVSVTQIGDGQIGDGGGGQIINGVVIESETLFTKPPETQFHSSSCVLRVQLRNTTSQLKNVGLIYNGFDAAGVGFAIAILTVGSSFVSPNSVAIQELFWAATDGSVLLTDCSRIARFELDPSSFVFP